MKNLVFLTKEITENTYTDYKTIYCFIFEGRNIFVAESENKESYMLYASPYSYFEVRYFIEQWVITATNHFPMIFDEFEKMKQEAEEICRLIPELTEYFDLNQA